MKEGDASIIYRFNQAEKRSLFKARLSATTTECLCQPISWRMAAILRDSAAVVIAVMHTRP